MDFVINFIQQIVRLIAAQSGNPISKEDEEVEDAYKWLLAKMKDSKQTEVQKHSGPFFQPGKIYVFKYEPKYASKYDYYDKNPVMLMLGKMPAAEGMMNVGINLSWYPPKARKYIVEKIREFYKSQYEGAMKKNPKKAIDQRSVELDLYSLKVALDQFGLSFAIRNYLPSQVKSPAVCISYEHWDKAVRLDQPRILPELQGKVTLFDIYKSFEDYIKKYDGERGMRRIKLDEAKKLNKFKFIK